MHPIWQLFGVRAVCALALAAAAACASAQSAASSPQAPPTPSSSASAAQGATAPLQRQLEAIRALQQRRPSDGLLTFYEAMTLAQLGDRKSSLDVLGRLAGRRLGLLPARGAGFDDLWDDPGFQALRQRLADQEPRTPDAPQILRLANPRLIPEGIAHDAKRQRYLIGSIAERKVVAVYRSGRVRDFSRPEDGLQAVLGLAVDAPRDRLCAISTNGFLDAAKQARHNMVACWRLADGRRVLRVDVDEAQQLNDVAIDGGDGSLWLTDSAEGSLWTVPPRAVKAQRVGAAGALRGANGLALAPRGPVYVALSTGIARVDRLTGAFARLPQQDESWVTGGIDGLYWHEGDLVGVQNVANPGRVVRLRLAPDGGSITGLSVLQSHHHPAFAEPTTGTIVGARLVVIANSHVAHFRPDGSLARADDLRGTALIAVPLKAPQPRG